ncbi:hypothetical protein AXF42_Ash019021 [Apostasia shenzhenica]|uniref:Uncharacterized protein n=1 Tax=Apostasia shenzhenica TaxID=1088818 RepID=A0A2I0AC37_9ASPA|nr:hypothetical protein AXF42_Ash019021 [Apostasia shenzhenica]
MRMDSDAFIALRDILVSKGLLTDSRHVPAIEPIGIFMRIIAFAAGDRECAEMFQHSLETISKYFNATLQAIVAITPELITLLDANTSCSNKVRKDSRFWPHFKNCLGTIDGTYISASVPNTQKPAYHTRKGTIAQNIIAVVGFDGMFHYVAAGWEGSASDMRVLRWALDFGDFTVPRVGKYYLVNLGYANTSKFLAPYRKMLYHIGEFRGQNARRYRNKGEKFNHRHACLRNVIERSFGILKRRFAVLNAMKSFPLQTQRDVVVACFALHNFIACYSLRNTLFHQRDTNEDEPELDEVELTKQQEEAHDHSRVGDRRLGDALHRTITDDLWGR